MSDTHEAQQNQGLMPIGKFLWLAGISTLAWVVAAGLVYGAWYAFSGIFQ